MKKFIIVLVLILGLIILLFNYQTILDKFKNFNNEKESEEKYKFELFNPEITFSTQIMDRLDE